MTRCKPLAVLITSLAAAVSMLSSTPAAAQDPAAVDKLVQMNKRALEDYDTLEWDAAKRTLLDALVAGKKAGLDNHPVMARTYVHLAAVYLMGFKNRDKAMQSFARALEIDPTIQLSKGIETTEVTEAFAEAQRQARSGGAGSGGDDEGERPSPPPPRRRRGPIMEDSGGSEPPRPSRAASDSSSDDESGEPDLPARITALDCPTPDEAILEKPLTLRCALSPKLPVTKVFLLYRAPGKQDYTELEMNKTPKGWYQAKVPKKAVTGKSLQFFFEGRNDDGKPIVANGGQDSPNIILIVEAGERSATEKARVGEDTENPINEDEGPKKKRFFLGRRNTEEEGLDTRFGKRKFWLGLGLGTGFGYAKGNGFETFNKNATPQFAAAHQFAPGLAFAGIGQAVPEIGYQITPDLAVSLEGRLQYIPQSGISAPYAAKGAISVLARLLFFTKQSQLRFYGSVMAGGGEGFRFPASPDPGDTNPATQQFSGYKDTVLGGPVVAGVGGGIYYETTKRVSLVGELNALGGFPTFSAVVDLNLSLQINFY